MRNIGIDLHKNMFTACFLEGDKTIIKEYKISDINSFKQGLRQDDRIAVEMLGYTRYFVNQIIDKVKPIVVNTTQFKIVSQSTNKTDKNDAKKLAFYLEKDMLPEVKMPEEKISEIRSLAHSRHTLVEIRTSLKNMLHSILNAHGIMTKRENFSSEKELDKITQNEFNPTVRLEIEVIIEQIKKLNEGIKKLEEEMISQGSKLEGFKNITSIKGIGKISGTILLSAINNINDFADEKKLESYFGIVPKVTQSNNTIHMGRITKQGNKLARTTLVQCTLIAIQYSSYLNSFYNKIKDKKGSGKAILATAKKLLIIIYNTLKNGWIFEDFPAYKYKLV
jgi:transposase